MRDFIDIDFHLVFQITNLYAHTNTSNYGTRKDFLFCFQLRVADVLKIAKNRNSKKFWILIKNLIRYESHGEK